MSVSVDQHLGPVTEARFLEVFSKGALAHRSQAADLVGLDVKTLDALTDAQVIRAVAKGKQRAWTERSLRLYLIEGPDRECAPRMQSSSEIYVAKAKGRPGSNVRRVNFSETRRPAR